MKEGKLLKIQQGSNYNSRGQSSLKAGFKIRIPNFESENHWESYIKFVATPLLEMCVWRYELVDFKQQEFCSRHGFKSTRENIWCNQTPPLYQIVTMPKNYALFRVQLRWQSLDQAFILTSIKNINTN